MLPDAASLVGEHAFSGTGVPEGFRFRVPPTPDLMPPLQLQYAGRALAANCAGMRCRPHARISPRAWVAVARTKWSCGPRAVLPDAGFGLADYQANAAVDRWLRETVLLSPTTTQCAVPKGVFPGEGAMLRVIAYGNELDLAYPPRRADPKAPWAPVWAVNLHLKSMAMVIPGMPAMGHPAGWPATEQRPPQGEGMADALPKPKDLLKGILGR